MSGNTFGEIFKVTTFGESHGAALGCVIDGCPAGVVIDEAQLQHALDRRKPGAKQTDSQGKEIFNAAVTARKESDTAEIVSGVFEGKSTGTPIAVIIRNENQHSKDYASIKDTFRPGHADYTYFEKYGIRDYRGGGRSSGRETAARVAAGAIAQMLLDTAGISITAYTKRAAGISISSIDMAEIERNTMRAPDKNAATLMEAKIEELRKQGDSAGGIIECVVHGVPAGLGEPVFDKLDAVLAQAMLSVGAVKGIEFGSGFECADMAGSSCNDAIRSETSATRQIDATQQANGTACSNPTFVSNNAGGILGGISRGDDIVFRVAVKPVPSIFKKQQTVNTQFENCDIEIEGRHDVCLCPRIVPVIEAMTALGLADMYLRNKTARV